LQIANDGLRFARIHNGRLRGCVIEKKKNVIVPQCRKRQYLHMDSLYRAEKRIQIAPALQPRPFCLD